jgi:hypothetical protein
MIPENYVHPFELLAVLNKVSEITFPQDPMLYALKIKSNG